MPADLSLAEARRIAIAAQALDRPRPKTVRAPRIAEVIERLGLLQLDFINVLAPAHQQVVFSRLGPYDRQLFHRTVYGQRRFTEQWAHEASIVPMAAWPLLRHRRDTHRVRPWGFEKFLAANAGYARRVIDAVAERGPITAAEAPQPEGERRMGDSWFTTFARATLEAFFGSGRLAVVERRPDFARVYDLAERVIPAEEFVREVDREESQRALLRHAARAHGVGTAADLADYFRMPLREAKPRLAELAGSGVVRQVQVEGWREPAYLSLGAMLPSRVETVALLSPFDPLIWFRPRAQRLFGFEYRVEIYVPESKRRWGYYVLPLLLGDRLVARADLRADRAAGTLRILSVRAESGVRRAEVRAALASELRQMADWLGLEKVGRMPAFQ